MLTYPKEEKLKSRKLIEALFKEGSTLTVYPLKLVFLSTPLPEQVNIQAGVTVPKRRFKKAVTRNYIKRLMREAYRHQKVGVFNNSSRSYAFLFLYLGKEVPKYSALEIAMQRLLTKFANRNDAIEKKEQ